MKLLLILITTYSAANGQLIYPNSAVYKFIVGLGVPIDVNSPGHSLGWLANIQGLYRTPNNVSYFEPYKIVQKRSLPQFISRNRVYESLKPLMERLGLPGKECLLWLICETAKADLRAKDDLFLGSILHILFTPSEYELLDSTYLEAFRQGENKILECSDLYNCTISQFL